MKYLRDSGYMVDLALSSVLQIFSKIFLFGLLNGKLC